MHRDPRPPRLAALAALGWLLFTDPLLSLLGRGGSALGVPALFAYLFGAWALLIALLATTMRARRR